MNYSPRIYNTVQVQWNTYEYNKIIATHFYAQIKQIRFSAQEVCLWYSGLREFIKFMTLSIKKKKKKWGFEEEFVNEWSDFLIHYCKYLDVRSIFEELISIPCYVYIPRYSFVIWSRGLSHMSAIFNFESSIEIICPFKMHQFDPKPSEQLSEV